jgi:hypothetical protein
MSGYLIAGLVVIAITLLAALWLRARALRADAMQAERERAIDTLLRGPLPFELDTRPGALEDDHTAPGYLTAAETDLPKWATSGSRH